jgi:hypothetical protein
MGCYLGIVMLACSPDVGALPPAFGMRTIVPYDAVVVQIAYPTAGLVFWKKPMLWCATAEKSATAAVLGSASGSSIISDCLGNPD